MKARLLTSAVLLSLLPGCGADNSSTTGFSGTLLGPTPPPAAQAVEEFGTGLDEPPQSVQDSYPRALPPEAQQPQATGLTIAAAAPSPSPPAVVNISCPPVQNQGHTGACVSFGSGYELISTVSGRGQRDLTNMAQCFSSAWGYVTAVNLEGKKIEVGPKGSTIGTQAPSYLETAVNVGGVSYASIPFPSPSPIAVQVRELNAINATKGNFPPSTDFQLGSWSTVENDVATLKSQLAQGNPMAISINVPHGMSAYRGGIFQPSPAPSPGGHCIFLKGYDDTKGAFIIQNSWGPNWGVEGNVYWAYNSLPQFLRPNSVHTAAPVSTEAVDPSTGGSSAADGASSVLLEVVRAHQAVSHDGRVHLVALVRLTPALKVQRYTLVSPSGRRASVTHGWMLRSGHLYLSRADNTQWTAGNYTLIVEGLAADGASVTRSVRFTLRALPNLPQGDTPVGVTGTNKIPVVVN